MNWIIMEFHNLPLILCGIFYSVLCVFSIVTGLMYASGRRKLNPIELSEKFVKKLDDDDKLRNFTKKMGWITFAVGIIQGITALAIFKGYSTKLWWIATGFTIFSILSVLFKLKGKINAFSSIKLVFYIIILIILILGGSKNYSAEYEMSTYLKSSKTVNVTKIKEGYFFDGPGNDNAIIFFPGARVEYKAYSKLMYKLAENGQDCFMLAMPFNLAFFNKNAPNKIINKYNYENWYLSGHSLGGVVACMYTAKNSDNISGIITLSAYPSEQLPSNIEYISFYVEQDKVLNLEKYKEAKKYLPDNSKEYIIEGGNHSGFANYGKQEGDGMASITPDVQQDYVVSIIKEILNKD